jgi:hypothetical protein
MKINVGDLIIWVKSIHAPNPSRWSPVQLVIDRRDTEISCFPHDDRSSKRSVYNAEKIESYLEEGTIKVK